MGFGEKKQFLYRIVSIPLMILAWVINQGLNVWLRRKQMLEANEACSFSAAVW